VVSTGSYLLSALALATLAASLAFSSVRLRKRLLPAWQGAPARLVEAVVAIVLLIWLSELLGLFNLLYASTLVASSLLLAGAIALRVRAKHASPAGGAGALAGDVRAGNDPPAGGAEGGTAPEEASATAGAGGSPAPRGPAGRSARSRGGSAGHQPWSLAITIAVIAVVFAHWGLTAKDALDRGIFNFDSLWYHMPFAVEMAHSHSVTGLHHSETVFLNWFYPQNAELLHAVGILLTQRDTLSLFLNFAWLGLAFLAAWCIGRPYGRGPLTVTAAAIVLECHTLVVREPGAAKNDLMAAALLLAAVAILVEAFARGGAGPRVPSRGRGAPSSLGPPLAAAGLAVGLAVGTKFTALAMAAALTVAVVALVPAGRRRAALGWWFLPAFAAGGYWYVRNLIVAGNPLPELTRLGPIRLLHPERLQSGRPDFSIAHYATDTAVWREYFAPGLHEAFGLLWPLVVAGAIAGGLLVLLRGRERALRWMGGVALFGLLAYLFTPLSAAGAQGAPTGFAINIRYAVPALLAGLVLLPLALPKPRPADVAGRWWEWLLLGALLLVLLVTDRSDAVLRDPHRLFGLGLAFLLVLLPAGALAWRVRARHASPAGGAAGGTAPEEASATAGGGGSPAGRGPAGQSAWSPVVALIALGIAILALGYPLERHYLRDRYLNANPRTSIPGMHLDSAYRWARGVHGARIGLAGTTAGFLEYGFYGTDLSNRVRYLGVEGPHGGFDPIATCRGFRAAVDAARLDYLVTAPFLDFIHPDLPVASPEAGWLRGEPAVAPLLHSGPVTVWQVRGRLDPAACGPANAPLRRVPQQPAS
jgi:hypothetical protein